MNDDYETYLNQVLETYDAYLARLDKREQNGDWDIRTAREIIDPVREKRQLVYRLLVRDPSLILEDIKNE